MSQETELLFKSSSTFSTTGTIAASLQKRSTRADDCCVWNTANPTVCTLLRDGIYAVEAYISAAAGKPVRDCAILKIADHYWSAEYTHTTTASTDLVVYNANNGVLEAANVVGSQYTQLPKYGSKTDPRSIASILFAMIPAFREAEPSFDSDMALLEKWYVDPATGATAGSVTWTDEADHAIHRVCDAFYRGLKDDRVQISSMSMGDIPALARARVKAKTYDGEIVVGSPSVLSGTAKKKSATAVKTVKYALDRYEKVRTANLALLTSEEKTLIPADIDNDAVVPDYAFDIMDEIIETADSKEPVNSVRIEGQTGHGKTFVCRMIAYILGLPYRSMNLNPDSDRMEIKESIVPNTTGKTNLLSGFVNGKPSMEDMIDDPVYAYEQITGIEKMDVTAQELQDAYDAAVEASVRAALNAPKDDKPQFVHVLSQLMVAIQRPGIFELQEASRARAGVMSGINEIFDRNGTVHCESTGEVIKRDPRCIIISTDNVGYAGCKPISADVRRRFAHIERLRPLEKKDAVARVMQRLGFTDKKLLEQMWEIVNATAEYCRINNITDGDVGLCELMFWAQLIQKGKNRERSFVTAVLNKATGNNETADEVWNAVKISSAAGTFFNS